MYYSSTVHRHAFAHMKIWLVDISYHSTLSVLMYTTDTHCNTYISKE